MSPAWPGTFHRHCWRRRRKADLLQQYGFNFRQGLHRAGDFHELALGRHDLALFHETLDLDVGHQGPCQTNGRFECGHNAAPHKHGEGDFGIANGTHDAGRVGEILVGLRREGPCGFHKGNKTVENGLVGGEQFCVGFIHDEGVSAEILHPVKCQLNGSP